MTNERMTNDEGMTTDECLMSNGIFRAQPSSFVIRDSSFIRHSSFVIRHFPRRGITLLECMISIFVLAVGLLGAASLLPVASFQAQRATIDDRKSLFGQTGVKDIKTRNFLRADYWLYANGNPVVKAQNNVGGFVDSTGNTSISLPPMAIDPLMVSSMVASFPGSMNTTGWFATNGGALAMPRCTLSTALGPAASQACMSQDDLVFVNNPGNADQLPYGGFNANSTKRSFNGQYSWLATLVPAYGDVQTTYNKNLMIMSLVVFNQRRFGIQPAGNTAPTPDSERAAIIPTAAGMPSVPGLTASPAGGFLGNGYGGGDLLITGSSANQVTLNIGEWLMLGWLINDQPSTSNPGTYGPRPFFRWYRIVTAGPIGQSGSTYYRLITVNGADISGYSLAPISNTVQAYAFIYDGAVAVYERPVRLEGPSMWSLY